jgi:hypothetical protein
MDIASMNESGAAAGLAQLVTPTLAMQTSGSDFGALLTESTSSEEKASPGVAATSAAEGSEEARLKAEAEAKRQASLDYLAKWIASGGAPEELERDRVVTEEEQDKDGDGVPDVLQHALPENALETLSQSIADPEDEGKVHVVVTKVDAEGKPKITRTITLDNGDGQDRSELTPERAEAKNHSGKPGASSKQETDPELKDKEEA